MSEIYDYLLDFNVKVVDPVYKVSIYHRGALIRQLGAYQIIKADLLKAYLLTMNIERQDPKQGKLIIRSDNMEINMVMNEKEVLKVI